ncbi:MAG TPA: aspartyl protease family protein [Candidatus Methylomirabilis sp.]|nr:aspartyl protease family protein [Candidatus Methylomirabilis sp.]
MKRLVPRVLLGLLFSLSMGAPSSASAQIAIYRWIDADGDLHYSQGIDSVPVPLRGRAVVIGYDRPAEPMAPPSAASPLGAGQVRFTPGEPIMVTARLNDAGSARLMLDTGATRTLISPAVLSALGVSQANAPRASLKGVTGEAEADVVKIDSIEVGGAKFGPLLVIAHDTGFGPLRGDGLLGRDYLDNFTVLIDNAAGMVTLTPK